VAYDICFAAEHDRSRICFGVVGIDDVARVAAAETRTVYNCAKLLAQCATPQQPK